MRQPIIDPAKVDAWTASMRGAFAGSAAGMWLIVGLAVVCLATVIGAAWWDSRRRHRHA